MMIESASQVSKVGSVRKNTDKSSQFSGGVGLKVQPDSKVLRPPGLHCR